MEWSAEDLADDNEEYTALQIRTAAYEAAAMGDAEIAGVVNMRHEFRLTPEGRARADATIDAAIFTHGIDAGAKLAEAMGIDDELGEEIVALRLRNRLRNIRNTE